MDGMSFIFRSPINAEFKQRQSQLFCEQVESDFCYGNYRELKFYLHKYCKASDRILATGCKSTSDGETLFIEDLYDAGFHAVVGVDSSEKNISTAKERNKENRPEIQFVVAKGFKVKELSIYTRSTRNFSILLRYVIQKPSYENIQIYPL